MSNRIKEIIKNKTFSLTIQIIAILGYLIYLIDTDSYYIVYVLCALFGIYTLTYNNAKNINYSKRKTAIYSLTSSFFTFFVLMSNYELWYFTGIPTFFHSAYKALIVSVGSISIVWNTLIYFDCKINMQKEIERPYTMKLKWIITICFCTISSINLTFLFVCNYPGNLTRDSISQMTQLLSGNYTNHHPFWHTMIIKLCVTIGMKLFHNINAAVACYSVAQIIFMSVCFTFCISTLYQLKVPSIWLVLTLCYFALMPYHILYSFTMWKDIPFGLATLLLITSLFRIFEDIGERKWLNKSALIIGSFGMCLWRSNGWIAFLLSALVFIAFFRKKYIKISILFSAVLVVTYVMIHPVLSYLEVKQPDLIESLSIPAQQIARVIVENEEISKDERDLLSKIVEIEKIPDVYKDYISDPVKDLVRKTANQEYLLTHKMDYLKLWIAIGLKHPLTYFKAWIDQTKGYWNGGYKYWIWSNGVEENTLGIKRNEGNPIASLISGIFFDIIYADNMFILFKSIGLFTWIIIACGSINLANGKGKRAFLSVPLLAIIATLCIATPVYSEFRYAYASFTCSPMIICATFYKGKTEG